jgi:hypothetical protein
VLVVELGVARLDAALQHEKRDALVHRAVQVAHVPQRQHRQLAEDVEGDVRQVLVLEQLNAGLARHHGLVRVHHARRLRRLSVAADQLRRAGGTPVRVLHRGANRVPLAELADGFSGFSVDGGGGGVVRLGRALEHRSALRVRGDGSFEPRFVRRR